MAINKFLGNSLISRLEKVNGDIELLKPYGNDGEGTWVDLCGLIAPKKKIIPLLDKIQSGSLNDLKEINAEFVSLHNDYYDLEWQWAYNIMLEFYNIKPEDEITPSLLSKIIGIWKESVTSLDRMLWEDARKEFSLSARTGFGFDGENIETQSMDFSEVRGQFESNPFVKAVEEHIQAKSALADKWLAILNC